MYDQDKNTREQIQRLNTMPESIRFNSVVTWNKIESRLQPKNSNRKAWFRWAAIFVFVITGAIVYLLSGSTSNDRPAGAAITKHPGRQNARSTVAGKTGEENKKPVVVRSERSKQQPAIRATTVIPGEEREFIVPPVEISPINETIITIMPAEQPQVTSTAPVVSINTVAKKPKPRIVHLNELYQPDPAQVAKAETKKQQQAGDEIQETEPVNPNPPKTFWKAKTPPRIAISLTDNP